MVTRFLCRRLGYDFHLRTQSLIVGTQLVYHLFLVGNDFALVIYQST